MPHLRREGRGAATPLLFLALSLVVSVPDARADLLRETEPDDVIAQARPVLPPVSVGGRISFPGDRDLVAFRVKAGAIVQASILARSFRADTAPGSSLTALLKILAPDGATVLIQDASQGDLDDPAVSVQVTQSGVYYASVEDLLGQGGNGYTYILSIEIEGDDSMAAAAPVLPPVLPSLDALIWPAGDRDLYRFEGSQGQTATIELDSAVFSPTDPPVKGALTLYGPDGSVLAADAYSVADPVDPFLQAALPATGSYVVEVRDIRGFVGSPVALYQLSIELGPAGGNDLPGGAEPIVGPRGTSGVLCPGGDRDDLILALSGPGTLSGDVDARQDLLSLLSGQAAILTPQGSVLAADAGTPDPMVSALLPAGNAVLQVGGTSSGLCQDAYYRLWIDSDPDGDGLRLPLDVCPEVYDPAQADTDHDGVGDACDTCVAVFNPGQDHPLRTQAPIDATLDLTAAAGGGARLAWTPAAGSIASDVYRFRSSGPGIGPSFQCLADNVPEATATDDERPAPGEVFLYVVTAENCGESDAGDDSAGRPRLVTPCPLPI
ncbi:MAG TPA: PPC domain-containing protein [Candidatus Polarisedimenticolia bacterium]|nr:PPC domain-containing protein [Candidatus Polarisedimenticolia bacterium]